MPERLDLEHGRDLRADLVCVLCARTVGRVQGPNLRPLTPMSLRVQEPRHVDAVRRLRCPYCSDGYGSRTPRRFTSTDARSRTWQARCCEALRGHVSASLKYAPGMTTPGVLSSCGGWHGD
jgi:hypothetical protein